MKILYLAHRIPYPPNKGDKIRSFHQIRHLAQKYELHLACLCDAPADLKYRRDLLRYCRSVHVEPMNPRRDKVRSLVHLGSDQPLSVPYFYRKSVQNQVDGLLAQDHFDAVVCFSSPMAEYVFRGRYFKHLGSGATGKARNPGLIMDFCDLDSDKWLQYSRAAKFPLNLLYRREARTLLRYEQRVNAHFDASIFISEREAALFRERYPEAQGVAVIANGVDSDYFNPRADFSAAGQPVPESIKTSPGPKIVFTGAMDYHANVDGVLWFASDIFPRIQAQHPAAQFWIVGSKPAPAVRKLAQTRTIQVTGQVPDIRPYYALADVMVVPLRLARGVQNKVLEAMAMGKAVVSTPQALEGIDGTVGHDLLRAETSQAFADAVLRALDDTPLRTGLGQNAREYVLRHHRWDHELAKLSTLLAANGTSSPDENARPDGTPR